MKLRKIKRELLKKSRRRFFNKTMGKKSKIAFISDVHGNLEALMAVINDIVKEDVDKIFCCGDSIGYGPNPNECLQLIKELKIDCVRGNHEEALIKNECSFTELALKSIQWTARVLTIENYSFLDSLPYSLNYEIDGKSFTIVHGSNDSPKKFNYIDNSIAAERSIYKQHILFVGHSHSPTLFFTGNCLGYERAFEDYSNKKSIIGKEGMHYIVNVGSVGQPRDRDDRACYSIYDLDKNTIEWKRVEYPVEKTQAKILEYGLPEFNATRLKLLVQLYH